MEGTINLGRDVIFFLPKIIFKMRRIDMLFVGTKKKLFDVNRLSNIIFKIKFLIKIQMTGYSYESCKRLYKGSLYGFNTSFFLNIVIYRGFLYRRLT